MQVTFDKADMLDIVFKDEQLDIKELFISFTFAKKGKSTDSKHGHSSRKRSSMLVTFDKADMLAIVFKDKFLHKNRVPITVTFGKQDKSTDSTGEHSSKKQLPMLVTFDKAGMLDIVFKDEQRIKNP
eukprot:TRINITY_DN6419_c2_g1_i1.p2 TRINITY_DN6419_c2_g1~~TRINITY_DN6419_c2_g1_i1.p2  ORF type:complete len:127 (-),score=26.39 TRINITY_DN6419_c2_g1_i1:9-389(-)